MQDLQLYALSNPQQVVADVLTLTPSGPHSRFREKLLGFRVRVSPKRECGPEGLTHGHNLARGHITGSSI